jgi:hypothetical protein
LIWSDPAVVEGGGRILLGGDEGVQSRLLGRAAAEQQRDAVQLERGGDGTDIVGGTGAERTRASERDAAGGVNRRSEAGLQTSGLREGGRGGAERKGGGRCYKR